MALSLKTARRLFAALLAMALVMVWVPNLGVTQAFAADPSSSFEDSDGNLTHGSLPDWADVSSNSQFSPKADKPSGQTDNSYGQGAKEDTPSPTVVAGQIPNNKADLTRDYVYWKKDSDGHLLIFLAYETANFTGSAHIDFEINQSSTLAANGVNPVRTPGDLLITYDWNGSSAVAVGYATWLASNQWSDVTMFASGQGQGASNAVTVHDPIANVDLAPGEFGEAGVDLTAAGLIPAGQCVDFASVLVKSRSSGESFQSELKDFIAPNPISVSNCGTIVVKKATVPAGGTGFGFTGDAHGTIDDGGAITVHDLQPGTYHSTETAKAGWALTDITCGTDGSGDLANAKATFDLHADQTITCTFTNTKLPTLTVKKVTNPASVQSFGFTASKSGSQIDTFSLTNGHTHAVSSGGTTYLPIGSGYSVAESSTTGWDLTDATCDNGDAVTSIALGAGDNVTCTFTNTERGHIVVQKVTDPSSTLPTFPFTLTGGPSNLDQSFSLSDGQSHDSGAVKPGSGYAAGETVPAGWAQTGASCDNESAVSDISVAAGGTTTCTFTNTKAAMIVVKKVTVPSGVEKTFPFTITGSGDSESFSLGDQQTHNSNFLTPGNSYDVAETATAGWDLTGATCDNGDDPSSVSPNAGQVVTCTFTNTERGHLIVVKHTVPSGSAQSFDFTLNGGDSQLHQSFSLSDGQSHDSGAILPSGGYDVAETVPAGWDQTSATCDDGDSPDAVTIAPGATVTCSFTNTERGHIVVVKKTVPSGSAQSFDFSLTGGRSELGQSFSLSDGQSHDSGAVLPGSGYAVAETVPADWKQTGASCDNGSDPGDVTVGAGQTVTCTLTNTHYVALTITKAINANGDSVPADGFTFSVSCSDGTTGALTFHEAGSQSLGGIVEGSTCDVTETPVTGWTSAPSGTQHVTVGPDGASVSFTNSRDLGVITVTKQTSGDPAGASTVFTFDLVCPTNPTFDQTLVIDASTSDTATSTPIPTGLACSVTEESTAGWQQTTPAQGGVDVTVPGSAAFTNTRLTGPLQLSKSVAPSSGSYVAGDPANTLTYTLSLRPTGALDHTDVVVTDYIPGYDPADTASGRTTYVVGSATCSTGCAATYDAANHLLTWAVGDVNHDSAPVVFTYKVTIDEPSFDPTVGLAPEVIDNVGHVQSLQQALTPSNEVKTPVTAVLAVKVTKPVKKPVAVLPFTGIGLPLGPTIWTALTLFGAGVLLTSVRRRRTS